MRNGSMNELKHNAFLKLNASLPECRSLERHSLSFLGRSGNSTQRFPETQCIGSLT